MKKIAILVLALLMAVAATGKVRLPAIVGDNMVLQRNTTVNIWGWSDANKKISITTSWNGKKYSVIANSNGEWKAGIATTDAGKGYSIIINDGDRLVLNNVMLGEVWVCSGQSNMEMPVKGYQAQPVDGSQQAILEAAQYSNIRLFTVGYNPIATPQADCNGGEWLISTPQSVGDFSATAYFFGKTLSKVMPDVPIGLINTSSGGSAIEAWLSREAINATPDIDLAIAYSSTYERSVPANLFNGMILPIVNYTSKGFIWYQGESNRHNPYDYPALLAAMVNEWRTIWGDAQMPFYYVQIAPYYYEWKDDSFEQPMIVEAQYKALKLIPYSGIAATTDIGHRSCIHPPQKPIVGERLALQALVKTYNFAGLIADAPTYQSMKREGNKLVLSFDLHGDTFAYFDGRGTLSLTGFEVAGEDKVFYPARAGFTWWTDDVEVWSDKVPEPVAVRYAFCNVPKANVVTVSGLPLPSFRTDDWYIKVAETR